MNKLLKTLGKGFNALAPGARGSGPASGRMPMSRDGVDLRAEAGALIDSSVVLPVLNFAVLQMMKAPLCHYRVSAQGVRERVPNSAIEKLLSRPVEWCDGNAMLSAWVVARILEGNAYTFKHRSSGGKLIGLEYLPLHCCWPESVGNTGKFIDYYRLALSSTVHRGIDPKDVLHLRWHIRNPWRTALGWSPLASCYPEIASDKRASRYEAVILRNNGKAHMLSPQGVDEAGNPLVFSAKQRQQLNALMAEETTGDAVGSIITAPYPVSAVEIGFKPKDMALEHHHNLSEERICACINVPPVLAGFGSGLDSTNNRASYMGALRQALFSFTIPQMTALAAELTDTLVPELGDPGDVIAFDIDVIEEYRAYRAEQDALDAGGPTYTVNEVRQNRGDDPLDGGDQLRQSASTNSRALGDAKPEPQEDDHAKSK